MGSPTKQTKVRRRLKAAGVARRRVAKVRRKMIKLRKLGKIASR